MRTSSLLYLSPSTFTSHTMELKYAHLCDYAGEGAYGKVIVVGIFDHLFATPQRPISVPSCTLVVSFSAHVTEGTEHKFELRFTDEDAKDMIPRITGDLRFALQGPGREMRANLFLQFGPQLLPDLGDYRFYVLVDGIELASVLLTVAPMPQAN